MDNEVPNTEAPAPVDTEAADAPLLAPTDTAEGAPAMGEGTETVDAGATPAENGDDKPLLTPGIDENGQSEYSGAPENYEAFDMPDGFELDDETRSQTEGMFRDLNLSQKGAQRLIDAYTERAIAQKESELTALAERRKQWRAEVRKSPTFTADRAFAIKGMNAVVSTPEERSLFTDSWMSDHPALFSMFVKVGKLLGEDTPLPGGGASPTGGSAVDRFPIKL